MKPTRQSKNEYIQMLLARGLQPTARMLFAGLSAEVARETERLLIAKHRRTPWNCNTADGGEGIVLGSLYTVYGLCEPWEDGRIFYIGVAVDIDARLKQHIAEAKDGCLTLTKTPRLGRFLADYLNGCPGIASVLDEHHHEPPFRTYFFRNSDDYLTTWAASGGDAESDTAIVAGWIMHACLQRRDFARIMAAFEKVGGLFEPREIATPAPAVWNTRTV
jgi:hypothetical protein